MALGERDGQQQQESWTPTVVLPKGPSRIFHDKFNTVLAKAGFDKILEELCQPFCASKVTP